MARGGVYRTDVEKARKVLLEKGKNPSIDAIREVLGTGSKSTIHRHIKDIEADDSRGHAKYPISDALTELVHQLATRLNDEAEGRITAARDEFEAQRRTLTEQEARRKQEALDLGTQLKSTEALLTQEKAGHSATGEALTEARATIRQLEERINGLAARLAEHETHAASLEQKHLHAREALEHYRTAAKEQRDQEQRRHEHQVQELQVAVRQASDTLTGKNHELLQLNRDNARLTEQVGQLDKELQRIRSDLRRAEHALSTMQSLEADHRALKAQWTEEAQAAERLRGELAAARDVVTVERQGRQEAEAIATRTSARLEVFEEMVARLGEKAASSDQAGDRQS